MIVSPGASFESVVNWGTTGATLGVRITDNVGQTVVARTTAGISEYPSTSGIYAVTLTAPTQAGQYSVVWDNGAGIYANDDLVVTTDRGAVIAFGDLYITRPELKEALEITDNQLDDELFDAISTACRAIDAYKGCRFYATTQTRVYTADDSRNLTITPANAITSVRLDIDGDGTYETLLTQTTDYVLSPANAALEGQPYTGVRLTRRSGRLFPTHENGVQVAGSFGWAACPPQVRTAAKILATRLFKRRETPFAFQVIAGETMSAARIGRIDPDVQSLLDQVPPFQRPRSIQMR